MAEDSNKEQLEIQAKLDTSQLKTEAKHAFNEVAKEEKKVEEQSKQTSKAIDDVGKSGKKAADSLQETGEAGKKVGDSLQQAGQAGSQALKEVSKEAEKTASKISDIDKSVKNLKLGQAIGIASRLANSDIGKGIGNAVGDSLGMSDSEKSTAGSAIQGGLQGAAIGAMVAGPWGAVIGGLGGAAVSLLQAGEELKKAAKEGEDRWEETKRQSFERQETEQFNNTLRNGTRSELEERLRAEEKRIKDANADIADARAQDAAITKKVVKTIIDPVTGGQWEKEEIVKDNEATVKKAAELTEQLTKAEAERADALTKQQALIAEITRREAELAAKREAEARKKEAEANLPVGPEIPDYIRAQRDAEANASVGPDIPPEILAQRRAEEQAQKEARKKQLDDLKIQEKALRDEAKEKLSSISGMSGMKLTDSLTQIGGGAGYGSQMRGITDHVQRVVNEVKKLNGIADSILNKMDNIKNEGVFTGDSE